MARQASIYVDAPTGEIFRIFQDPRNWQRVLDVGGVVYTDVVTTPDVVGTTYGWELPLPGGRRLTGRGRFAEVDPGRRIVDISSRAFEGTFTYLFEPVRTGTRLTVVHEPRGIWRFPPLKQLLQRESAKTHLAALEALKTLMEQPTASPRGAEEAVVRRRVAGAALPRMGRSSLRTCVRATGRQDPTLEREADRAYDDLLARVPRPLKLADQGYLALVVLPVAALYTALRGRGLAQGEAVAVVRRAFLSTGKQERAVFTLICRTRPGRRLFLRSLRPNWLWLTPAPTNRWTVTARTPDSVTIEVSRCFRWDAFRRLGVPEVAGVACDYERYVFDGSPSLDVAWASMPAGAERCRICLTSVRTAADVAGVRAGIRVTTGAPRIA